MSHPTHTVASSVPDLQSHPLSDAAFLKTAILPAERTSVQEGETSLPLRPTQVGSGNDLTTLELTQAYL